MTFEYLQDIKFMDSIDIEDIGNFTLEAVNDEGSQWYLQIETELGYSKITTVGTLMADSNFVTQFFNFNYQTIEYNERKLVTIIDKFINDPKKNISQLFFSSKEALEDRLKNLQEIKIYYGKD